MAPARQPLLCREVPIRKSHDTEEIRHFFLTDKTRQNKVTEVGDCFGIDKACEIPDASLVRYAAE